MTDALTGLPTRRDGLPEAIRSHGAACCLVDIDNLIWLNDQFGHVEGDRAIASVAEYLRRNIRVYRGAVYRVGGDEFLLLFSQPFARSRVTEAAAQIVDGVRALRIPYRRLDRPERTLLEVNVAVLGADDAFAEGAFSEFGLTSASRDWIGGSIYEEKQRVGRDAGIVVDLFDAPGAPWGP